MEGIKIIKSTLTEQPKARYWRLKQQKMVNCKGCKRRTRREEQCCTANYHWQNDAHFMTSPTTGRQVMQPYRKLNARS